MAKPAKAPASPPGRPEPNNNPWLRRSAAAQPLGASAPNAGISRQKVQACLEGLFVCALALAATPALAFDDNIEAGLTIERMHLDLRSGAQLRATRLNVFLSEQLQPGITLSLKGGPVHLTQQHNPDTAGMDFTGFNIGVAAHTEWFRQQPFGLAANISYDYQYVDDTQADRKAKLELHTAQTELTALARLPGARYQLGVYGIHLDGDETISGPSNSSRAIKADHPFGGFLQADFQVDWTGRISLRLDGGTRQAVGLTFSRQF